MSPETDVNVDHESLFAFCAACFEKLGLSRSDSETIADNLIFANLRGVDSHGVIRMKIYAERLRAGGINPKAELKLVRDGQTYALIDADNGAGQLACSQAMKLAITKAKQVGIALVGVKNSNHFGAAAYYAMMALEHGMIGFAATNASPTMAPTGGREARLGNNPLAIAVPADKEPPIVLDMASGAVAKGKIFIAQQEKKRIPLTWALDENGVLTDDPDAAAAGLIQPIGGYKGYGLSLMIDILTGVLCGGGFSTYVDLMYKNVSAPTNTAHTCAALSIENFMPLDEFRRRVDQVIHLMRSCPRATGVERIYVPGEIEYETERQRRASGIPISRALIEQLRELGSELGVELQF
jgi:LDH2 family malate/lactate/ureidoglycolate dehydrogenase